jgi:oxygen-dependent protoporphyrinogen oxidase
MTVLVVGGGITGLTTAYALGQAGVPTILAEASGRLGGKVGTVERDGFLVESGPDSFISYRPAGLALIHELGLDDSLIRPSDPRTVLIRARGRFAHLPDGMGLVLPTRMRPFVTSDLFSPLDKLRMGLDLVLPRDGLAQDVAVGTFLRRRLGNALVERLAGPLIGGVYGTPVDELSLLAVVPQLRDADRDHRSLLLASLASGRARKGQPSGSPFLTLAGGTGRLIDGLLDAIGRSGDVELRTDAPVVGLATRAGGYDVRLADGELLRPDAVVLTTPGPVAADLLDDLAPEAAARIRTIRHGGTAVVSFGYSLDAFPTPPVGHGFLVAAGEPLAIDACTYSSRKWVDRAPEGSILLRCFLGSHDPRALALSDTALIERVRLDLERVLGVRAAPTIVHISRFVGQMPHYTVGHLDRVAGATDALATMPGLILAGAPYRGVGMPDCIAQGRAAATAAIGLLAGEPTIGGSGPGSAPVTPAPVTPAPITPAPTTVALHRVAAGSGGRIASVGDDHRSQLVHEGLRPGARVAVRSAAPFGGPLVLQVGRARVALARSVARTVEVTVDEERPEATVR